MANAKNLRAPWPPGHCANPLGRPRLSAEMRAIKTLSRSEMYRLFSKYARMTKDEAEAISKDPKTPFFELAIIAAYCRVIKTGDITQIAVLIDQTAPKLPPGFFENDEEKEVREMIENMSDEELFKMITDKIPERK